MIPEIKLGATYRDLTGFVGVATSITTYYDGSKAVGLARVNDSGKIHVEFLSPERLTEITK